MNPIVDLFLPAALCRGPILGKTLPWLHYGRPVRPLRFGKLNRALSSTIFSDTGGGSGSGSGPGGGGYGDPVLIEGPGPMYGDDDDQPADDLTGGGGGPGTVPGGPGSPENPAEG